jgi:hypothetical protein
VAVLAAVAFGDALVKTATSVWLGSVGLVSHKRSGALLLAPSAAEAAHATTSHCSSGDASFARPEQLQPINEPTQ